MNDYTYSRNFKRYNSGKLTDLRKAKTIVVLFIFSILTILLIKKLPKLSVGGSILNSAVDKSSDKNLQSNTLFSNQFTEKLRIEMALLPGTYSIFTFDLKSGKEFGINENTTFIAASVNKIPVLAALYHLADKNEVDLEEIIVPQSEDIQDYGTGSIRYDKPGTPYSIKTLARLMMEKSDNTAAHILGKIIIGLPKIQQLIESWGLVQTDMENNKTSNHDISILLTKMYKGEITNPALTSEMLDFMDNSDFEDRIPAGVMDTVKVYHKTGDDIGKIHDVGIVDLTSRPYFLGILTSDMTDEESTKKNMAKISELVYQEMIKL